MLIISLQSKKNGNLSLCAEPDYFSHMCCNDNESRISSLGQSDFIFPVIRIHLLVINCVIYYIQASEMKKNKQKKKKKKKKKKTVAPVRTHVHTNKIMRFRGCVTPLGKKVHFSACVVRILSIVGKFVTHWRGL